MLDSFRQLKLEYKEYVLLFKSGAFYVSLDEDAIVLNKLFNYKIVQLKNNLKVGFPKGLYEKNINALDKKKINYVVIENRNIVLKKKFKYNAFSKYSDNIYDFITIYYRINDITEKLKKLSNSKNIDSILSNVEEALNG